ncbi:M23 family metallopeptidase, partial [Rhodobacter capsulatus]
SASPVAKPAARQTGAEPIRHRVARGETAYSIARYYNVPAKSVADWNGLPADLSVREGQMLMIPPATGAAPRPATAALTEPGEGSPTPEPPSAAKPLPKEVPPKASAPVDTSAAPDLGAARTEASRSSKFVMPVPGAIIRPYAKGKNDGVDIRAAAGTAVKAADAGTVAAITKDTEQVPILVLRHEGGLLTVYANIDGITVAKGDKVRRGQSIAKVRAGDTGFLHFEVRKGYDSVDPMPYLD